jgi:hypothetical protein
MATNCMQSWEGIPGLLQTIGNVAKGSISVVKVGWKHVDPL